MTTIVKHELIELKFGYMIAKDAKTNNVAFFFFFQDKLDS